MTAAGSLASVLVSWWWKQGPAVHLCQEAGSSSPIIDSFPALTDGVSGWGRRSGLEYGSASGPSCPHGSETSSCLLKDAESNQWEILPPCPS